MKLRRARARARFPLARCGGFDAVVTCFFIDCVDTARALEVIAGCLREGGAWINLGPVGTAQLNWRECARIAECLGFAFEIDEVRPPLPYCMARAVQSRLKTNCLDFSSVFSLATLRTKRTAWSRDVA